MFLLVQEQEMKGDGDSNIVIEENQDQEVVGKQDKAKKLEEDLENKAKRMHEKRERKKEMEEENEKEMEEELEKKAKQMQAIKNGKKKVEEEEEWEWEVEEGQEGGRIKNQEADNNNIKKKSFLSKLVSKISWKEKLKVDDDPLMERLIKLEMQRELHWRARRILGNGRNAPGAFDQVLEVLHDLKITNIKDLEPQRYMLEHLSWMAMPEPSVAIAELQNEFRMHVARILSEEGGIGLKAYEQPFNRLSSITTLQDSLEEKYGHLQDSMPSLCGTCQSPITEDGPFADEIEYGVLYEDAKDFHRPCLDSWLQQPQPTFLPRVEDGPMFRNINIFKLMDSWKNPLEIYETRRPSQETATPNSIVNHLLQHKNWSINLHQKIGNKRSTLIKSKEIKKGSS